jgi:RNA polymerase sigma-70 factor, ECF subfamily
MNYTIAKGERGDQRHRSPRGGADGQSQPAGGDAAAVLDQLYAQHWANLVNYVNRRLNDLHQSEEIAQETMLRAWQHADELTPHRGSVWGWLCRVARNIMVDRIRHKRARPAEVDETAAAHNAHVTADHSPDVVNSVSIARAIAQLSPEHREVLYLVYYQGRTCAEAAAVLGIPVGTAKSRLHRALCHLRGVLAPEQDFVIR